MMTKKILIITPKFYPSIGGIEEQVKLIGQSFIKKGYEVDILTSNFDNFKKKEKLFDLNVFRFKNIFEFLQFLIKKGNKYEIIISRQYYKNSSILGFLKFLKIIKTTTIICTDSGGENDEINNIKNKLSFLKLYKIYFYFIGKNNFLNVLNKYNLNHLKEIYNGNKKILNKITNIYNGIDTSSFKERKINKITNILFLGRFEEEKGIFKTIKAFKIIKNKDIKLHLVGYGDKEIEDKIKELIKNDKRIIYHGKKYGEEKEKIINNTDLFVFPTYYPEGQPVVLTEITLKNIPVITTDTGNTKDIYGNNVIYVKHKDIFDLKEKIEWIINNIDNYNYNYKGILNKIDINTISNQFLKLKK